MIALLRVTLFFALPALVLGYASPRYSPLHYGVREIAVLVFFFLIAIFLMRKVGPFSLAQFLVLLSVAVSQTAVEYLLQRYGYSQKFAQSLWELPANYDGILAAAWLPLAVRSAAAFIASRF
ncbi:MAG TPA: hypothetical protein PKW28_11570 [Turneriella sp.]|nr:hypothetical protein [Turneriella sp.]